MSAAGRGERVDKDQYFTPAWCVERLCEAVALPWGTRWCEPGAGSGAVIHAANSIAIRKGRPLPEWWAYELDERYRGPLERVASHVAIGCFIQAADRIDTVSGACPGALRLPAFDFALGNPSYSITTGVVLMLRRICREFCLLLPVTYLGSAGRCDMFQRDQPDIYLLPNRPCFVKVHTILTNGKVRITTSDSSEYAWFYWPDKLQTEGKVRVLNKTPADVLRAAKDAAPMIYVDKRRKAA